LAGPFPTTASKKKSAKAGWVVYRARDLSLPRSVVIKFLASAVATEAQRRQFEQEAQTASSLNL
jgi:hypothetical protein